jgi:glutamyl-tRNA reductase
MEIAVIGISYKKADIDLRGKVAFTTSMKSKATNDLVKLQIPEFVILSTCNRSEIYIASSNIERDIEFVRKLYISMAGLEIVPYLYVYKTDMAVHHLYQVATGLDSLVVGEGEILGQLKAAMEYAVEMGSCKKYLNKVIRESITFSKKVRTEYKLAENKLSIASISIDYLKERYGSLKNKKILLIGTGEMGQLILKYLEEEQVQGLYLTNRTMHKDKIDFFVNESVQLVEYHERYSYLNDMDIVISATASPHTIINRDKCHPLTNKITFLDMAVPRDIDAAMEQEELAEVVTLDTFQQIANKHMAVRQETANQINQRIDQEVQDMKLWILQSKADTIIQGFQTRQAEIIESKMLQIKKMGLDVKQEKEILDMIKSSLWQMIKNPINQLKAVKEMDELEQYKLVIEELFEFESGEKYEYSSHAECKK